MKKLLSEWRKFLIEQEAKFDGILKISLSPEMMSDIESMQAMLPEEAKRLDFDDLHVTLAHQSIMKPFREQLAEINLPSPPPIILEDNIWQRESLGKKSWAVRISNQNDFRQYVAEVMKLLGSKNENPEPERVFHISLANLTGNPYDSVR